MPVRARRPGHVQRVPERRSRGEGDQARDRRLQQATRRHAGRDAQRDRVRASTATRRPWRPIAIHNGVDDPRTLAIGQRLLIPQLPFSRSGDGGGDALSGRRRPAPTPRITVSRSTGAPSRCLCGRRSPACAIRTAPARPTASRSASRTSISAGCSQHIRGLGFQPFPTGIKIGPRATPPARDGLFDVDNKLELSMGYAPGPLEDLFKGEITGVQASFPSGGMPTMTIVAHDYLHRLTEGKYARGFGPLPDCDHRRDSERREPPDPDDRPDDHGGIDRDRRRELHLRRQRAKAERPERPRAAAGDRRVVRRGLLGRGRHPLPRPLLPQGVLAATDAAMGGVAARFLSQGEHRRSGSGGVDEVHAARDPAELPRQRVLRFRPRGCGDFSRAGRSGRRREGDRRSDLHDHGSTDREPGRYRQQRARDLSPAPSEAQQPAHRLRQRRRRPAHPCRRGDHARRARSRLQRRLPRDSATHSIDTSGYRTSFQVRKEILP